ncbi:hypothetical protein SAY86_020364 [Trapa natans]|uniref:Pectinesterase inhibitor domain-containing protein n=1 Tax=Trapa natans TaxID=22666 RepID=A0AAN7LN99_TRANT|nr:hypothetical protein SAY86_020364 [Trapa natans]
MEAQLLSIFLLFPVLLGSTAASGATAASSTGFIKKSCSTTTYPSLCYSALSPCARTVNSDPWKLCGCALKVSHSYAVKAKAAYASQANSSSLTKAEKAAVKQCRENMGDSVDQLKQSVQAMSAIIQARSSGSSSAAAAAIDLDFQVSNVKTYASAAITDDSTCLDGLEEMRVRANLKMQIVKLETVVEKLTSNALSLVNKLKY